MNDTTEIIRFGDFRIDLERRLLEQAGEPVPLTPKALDLLAILAANHGRTMSRAELMDAVWPDVAVEEANLTQNISLIRKALGERAGERQFVVTVPGLGYRFVGDSERAQESEDERRWKRIAIASIVALIAVAFIWIAISRPWKRLGYGAPIESIAVLPFQAGWGSPADDRGVGLADAVIVRLAATNLVLVPPTSDVMEFRDPRRDSPSSVGRQLGVDAVMTGAFVRDDEVAVQLVRSSDGGVVWSTVVNVTGRDSARAVRTTAVRIVKETASYIEKTRRRID